MVVNCGRFPELYSYIIRRLLKDALCQPLGCLKTSTSAVQDWPEALMIAKCAFFMSHETLQKIHKLLKWLNDWCYYNDLVKSTHLLQFLDPGSCQDVFIESENRQIHQSFYNIWRYVLLSCKTRFIAVDQHFIDSKREGTAPEISVLVV